MTSARRIRVTGIVQGVGFRPFVWRLAQELNLAGWVRNDAGGVEIFVEGAAEQVAGLLRRLRAEAPPLARIDAVNAVEVPSQGQGDFTIAGSIDGAAQTTIGPDVAVCDDCLNELFDPASRRWRHGFITCTHCGPRYTVTRSLPYDRARTSLAPFPLCAACADEYARPADRRFHAETTCCNHCGPRLDLRDSGGKPLPGDPITACLELLRAGAIVAIKGLGGFHLACDARNAAAVARLRERKNREAKPFAVMVANAASLVALAEIAEDERPLLESRERPVVLLRKRPECEGAMPGVAPDLIWLGAMLPTTPIHFLLFHEAAGRPTGRDWLAAPQEMVLVMTSANPGGEPIVRDDDEAFARLAGIADAILGHDRAIVARCDDSVILPLQIAQPFSVGAGLPAIASGHSGQHFIRRSRGYTPAAIRLPGTAPSVLAFGAHLKNAICLTRGDEAFFSPHIGDLDNAATCNFLDETVERLCALLATAPEIVAHDLHPDTYSSHAALGFSHQRDLPLVAVQHHHAHIAAVCVERGYVGPVLGLALDGVGLGRDGTAWGGELLRVDGAHCERLGHLRPLPLPGGDRAAREPWRMAAAVLHELGRGGEIARRFPHPAADTIAAMLARQINCPPSSSMGRWFDAAAGLLGLCHHMRYEAQAAMRLEQAATRHIEGQGWPTVTASAWAVDGQNRLDLLPALALLDGAADIDRAAALFHAIVADALADWVARAASANAIDTIAISGGCFFNRLLSSRLRQNLQQRRLRTLAPDRVSPGDGGIALGQAWVAIESLRN